MAAKRKIKKQAAKPAAEQKGIIKQNDIIKEPAFEPMLTEPKQAQEPKERGLSWTTVTAGIVIAVIVIFFAMRIMYSPATEVKEKAAGINLTPIIIDEEPQRKQPLLPLNHRFTFEEVFNKMRDIDKKYNTDFRKESLSKSVLSAKSIDPAIADMRTLSDDLNRSIINNESIYWIHLVEGRILQLQSEKYFQAALSAGKEGLFKSRDVEGSCKRQQQILETALLYNLTALRGGRAMYHFDMALTQERTWPSLGINEKKMAFFGGDTRDIGALAYNNVELVRTKCMGLPRGEVRSIEETLDANRLDNLSPRKY